MFRIDIDIDGQQFDTDTSEYLRGVFNPAIAAGINGAAALIQAELVEAANKNFDRPSAFTLRAFGVLPARATGKKTPAALISVRPRQAQYLELQIDGGIRRAGDYGTTKAGPLIPGPAAKVNRHGNLPRGYVARILKRPDVFMGGNGRQQATYPGPQDQRGRSRGPGAHRRARRVQGPLRLLRHHRSRRCQAPQRGAREGLVGGRERRRNLRFPSYGESEAKEP